MKMYLEDINYDILHIFLVVNKWDNISGKFYPIHFQQIEYLDYKLHDGVL